MTEHYIHHDGTLANGCEYTVVGRPVHGSAEQVSKHITKVGQDAALVLPRHNVVAVFDGAGGATDIGSPEEAALTAADAIETYLQRGDDDLQEAMQFARNAVTANPAAGICVGALTRITKHDIESVAAGDSGALLFTPATNTVEVIAEQQIHQYEPANYLGRDLPRLGTRTDDKYNTTRLSRDSQEAYVMSDGVLGSWQAGDDLQNFHFQAAHSDYQLLRDATASVPYFTAEIQRELTSQHAKQLAKRQIRDTTSRVALGSVYSPELLNPEAFNPNQFDWDIWHEIVLPYIESLDPPRSHIGRRAICETLITRPIAWPFERTHKDDATVVMVDLPKEA